MCIRDSFYTEVYKEQKVTSSKDDIIDFLKSEDNIIPNEILTSQGIPDNIRDEIETPLSKEELTKALFEDMKPNSAPVINGFSILFIREFWDSLVDLVWKSFI